MLDDLSSGSLLPGGGCRLSSFVLLLTLFSILFLWFVMLLARPGLPLIWRSLVRALYWYPRLLQSPKSYCSVPLLERYYSAQLLEPLVLVVLVRYDQLSQFHFGYFQFLLQASDP